MDKIDREIIEMQSEWLVRHRLDERITIVRESAGFSVHQHTADGVAPSFTYPTAAQAVARVAQLFNLRDPITPQNWPERCCIGTVTKAGEP